MTVKWETVILLIFPLALGACITDPETIAVPQTIEKPVVETPVEPDESPSPSVTVVPEEPGAFDPSSISHEVFQAAKADVQNLVRDLNQIIRARNFNAWKLYLGEAYINERSSPAFLDQISSQPRWQNQKRLVDFEDYFLRVVVPSRASDQVDDIEFINVDRVKAYTVNNREERLRLYDLERTIEGWKIIN